MPVLVPFCNFHPFCMQQAKIYLVIAILGSVLFFPFLGAAHLFDWDEINFAEAAREMLVTGNYTQTQIDFRQFWEKPPLFIWMQAASMHLFGVNEFAARFPNAICGIVTLCSLFAVGKRWGGRSLAGWWVLLYAGSILPQFYFKSGIIDPWFNLFIFLSVFCFMEHTVAQRKMPWLLFAGIAAGLSALTKGPVGIGLIVLTVCIYYALQRFRNFPALWHLLIIIIGICIPLLPWVVIEVMQNGTWFLKEFFIYQLRLAGTQDAGHGGFPGYHLVVLLLFCFPASSFAVGNMFHRTAMPTQQNLIRRWMLVLFWVVLIVFSIVQTKIAHYSSMAYFPLTFLAAQRLQHNAGWSILEKYLLGITGLLFAFLLSAIPFILQRPELLSDLMQDPFSKEAIYANAGWRGAEIFLGLPMLIGLCIMFFYLRRKSVTTAAMVLLSSSIITINLAVNFLTPRIERYSQGAMIDFFTEKSAEDCYTDIAGYKSYAQLFYGARKQEDVNNPLFLEWSVQQGCAIDTADAMQARNLYSRWLMEGAIDKPAYFVTNARKQQIYREKQGLIFVGNKNGFYFFKRESSAP